MTALSIQPIPYQGSKRALAPRICRHFPGGVKTLYEPFAGSAAVTLYAAHHEMAEHFVIGDVHPDLMGLWHLIINEPAALVDAYGAIWRAQFDAGLGHFNSVRAAYNADRDPVKLLYLIARSVKNAVRFNSKGQYSQSPDKRRTGMQPERLERSALAVSKLLKGRVTLFTGDFQDCMADAGRGDLVYMDPPYQGTTYSSDRRYAQQLERQRLIEGLMALNARGTPFILSYDGQTGDKTYGEPLPATLELDHLQLAAGRSSQATLSGRNQETIESLYLSKALRTFDITALAGAA